MKIKVEYTGGLDSALDKKIEKAICSIGFEHTGSGMLLEEQIRDLAFKKVE